MAGVSTDQSKVVAKCLKNPVIKYLQGYITFNFTWTIMIGISVGITSFVNQEFFTELFGF